ncbi:hypothetical protein Bca4012_083704 [Brassica carinata]
MKINLKDLKPSSRSLTGFNGSSTEILGANVLKDLAYSNLPSLQQSTKTPWKMWMFQLTFGWDKVGTSIVKTVHVVEKETY